MKSSRPLREEADQDLINAANWYERQRSGLGHYFLDKVLAKIQSISEQPLIYPVVHRNTRKALMDKFTFGLYFRIEDSRRFLPGSLADVLEKLD